MARYQVSQSGKGRYSNTTLACSMTDIDRLLEKARGKAEDYGELYGNKETADDYLKTTYAMLYEEIPSICSSVAERDAWIKRQPAYTAAIERKKDAYAAWKTAETFMKLLLTEAEVWRSKEASSRWIDKGHT